MQDYGLYALIVSVISLSTSGLVVYISYFKPAKLEMIVGKSVSFYPLPERVADGFEWGGLAFQIPITFQNWSPKGGTIEEVRIVLEYKNAPNTNFDMAWCTFTHLHSDEFRWVNKSVAQPIAVSGKSAISEMILFAWKKNAGYELKMEAGEYVIKILAWETGDEKPSLKFEDTFIISKEVAKSHANFMAKKLPMTVDIPLGESSRTNTVISRAQVKELYQL